MALAAEKFTNVEFPEFQKMSRKRTELRQDFLKFLEKNFDDELKCKVDAQTINEIVQIAGDWAVGRMSEERSEAIKEFVAEMKANQYGEDRSDFLDALEEIG